MGEAGRERGPEQYGEQRLRTVADGRLGEPMMAELILADVLEFQGGNARDDSAVVTVTVPDA